MKTIGIIIALAMSTITASDNTIYQFTMKSIDGEEVSLSDFKGKVVMIVNVASKCGNTPQYKELQALYDQKKDEGLVILGFPANTFLGQEPGSDEQIKSFCQKNYGVTFPMFSKISVKGNDMHPLYQFLTEKDSNGEMDSSVKWNFQKYVIGKDGRLREVVGPSTSVMNGEAMATIEKLLAE